VIGRAPVLDEIEGVAVFTVCTPVLSRAARAIKRTLDIVAATVLVVVLAPAMAAIALAVRLDSPGPALFCQRRVGRGGQTFALRKFRTMVTSAEGMTAALRAESSDPHWLALDRDPRVTRLGRVLRRTSLDELPQLWNVLKGEMSLVGPRPLVEAEDNHVIGWARRRLDVTPGLTGLWQVLGRTRISFEEMVKLDYLYVTNWSLYEDVRILFKTLPALLTRRGAN
jgi:lipopolysaccharide/colanic/teichoic acid biosynthesis glycosyltransferase